jgi:hypothetical protein
MEGTGKSNEAGFLPLRGCARSAPRPGPKPKIQRFVLRNE